MLAILLLAELLNRLPTHLSDPQFVRAVFDQLEVKAFNDMKRAYSSYGSLPHDAKCEMGTAAAQIAITFSAAAEGGHLHSFPEGEKYQRGDISLSGTQRIIMTKQAKTWERRARHYTRQCL